MTDTKNDILAHLKDHRVYNDVNDIESVRDIELVRIEYRIEDRIKEVKTDLKGDILQVKTDLENNIIQVKTDLENDIQVVRDDIKERIAGLRWFIGTTVAIAAVIVPILSKYL